MSDLKEKDLKNIAGADGSSEVDADPVFNSHPHRETETPPSGNPPGDGSRTPIDPEPPHIEL